VLNRLRSVVLPGRIRARRMSAQSFSFPESGGGLDSSRACSVAEVVWPWRRTASPGSSVMLESARSRALVQSLVLAAVAVVARFAFQVPILAHVPAVAALVFLVLGVVAPRGFLFLQRWMAAFGRAVGVGLSWVLLTPLYYSVFLAGRAVLRARGRDPMRREFPSASETCWDKRGARTGDHTRQYL